MHAGAVSALLARSASVLAAAAIMVVPALGLAAPKPLGRSSKQALAVAKTGDCVAAVPLLEHAEAEDHRPSTAAALAECHVALGEILLAREIYAALAEETASASWDPADRRAAASASQSADDLDERIPRVTLSIAPPEASAAASLEVRVGGTKVRDPSDPIRVAPNEKVEIAVKVDGYAPKSVSVLLTEREEKSVRVVLEASASAKKPPKADPAPPPDALPKHWLGARFRGLFVPTFVMNVFADGGTTTYLPGVGVTYTARLAAVDIEPSVTFTSYGLGPTAFKAKDTPDTEWEIVESDLWGAVASVDVLYRIPISAAVEMRLGVGIGIGWAFTGDVYRWQSYPDNGEPGDPSTYQKCKGPNDPPGTFRYCNQLDKDADRYGRADDTWGDGGVRPVVYPWLSLPQISFAFRPVDNVSIDLELGVTLNGFLTGTAVRFGL